MKKVLIFALALWAGFMGGVAVEYEYGVLSSDQLKEMSPAEATKSYEVMFITGYTYGRVDGLNELRNYVRNGHLPDTETYDIKVSNDANFAWERAKRHALKDK